MCWCTGRHGTRGCCCPRLRGMRSGSRRRGEFCDQRSFDVSYYPGIDPAAARANIYNDLPAVSFANGEIAADGPDDSIADEAGAVLAGRPSASAAAFSLAPMTLDRPFFFSALRLSDIGLLLRRLEVLPQAEIGALVNLAVLVQAAVIAVLVLLVPLAAGRRVWPERGGIGLGIAVFSGAWARVPGYRDFPDRAGQPVAGRPHQWVRAGADRDADLFGAWAARFPGDSPDEPGKGWRSPRWWWSDGAWQSGAACSRRSWRRWGRRGWCGQGSRCW